MLDAFLSSIHPNSTNLYENIYPRRLSGNGIDSFYYSRSTEHCCRRKDLALKAARKAVKKVGIDPHDFNAVNIDSSGHGMDDYLEILRMGPGRDEQSRYARIRNRLGNREYWVVTFETISDLGSRSKDGVTVVLDSRTWKTLFTFCSLRACD